MGWYPKLMLDELDDIMKEQRMPTKADAKREMVKYARVGREVDKLRRGDFSRWLFGGKKRVKR